MIRVLFAGHEATWPVFEPTLAAAFEAAGLSVDLSRDHAPETVDYIVYAPTGPLSDFSPYTRAKAVLGLWAGVETVVGNDTLTQPYTRLIEDGLTEGMVEWVVGHTLRHHLNIDHSLAHQSGAWVKHVPPLARDRKVGILGMGELGQAVAHSLQALRFDVSGWRRRAGTLEGLTVLHGQDGLNEVLRRSEILILLLPLTSETENLLNAERLARLPKDAVIINAGRGPLIDDAALLVALETHLGHATLDVFRTEPLPPDHPFWAHPKVTVTPHIASETRAEGAAKVIAENVRRSEAGEPLLYLVDRASGY